MRIVQKFQHHQKESYSIAQNKSFFETANSLNNLVYVVLLTCWKVIHIHKNSKNYTIQNDDFLGRLQRSFEEDNLLIKFM